mgnify:FL=1
MPLIVEDGTLPAGANSFASVADADAYHAARLTAAWTDELAEAQKEAALIRAARPGRRHRQPGRGRDQHRLQRHGPGGNRIPLAVRPVRRARYRLHGQGRGIMEVGRG